MKLSNDQIAKLIGAVISFIIAVLAVLGYQVTVITPQLQELATFATSCK